MAEYLVTWEIDLTAADPIDAARQAYEIQRDWDSTATVFTVAGDDGSVVEVDVLKLEAYLAEEPDG